MSLLVKTGSHSSVSSDTSVDPTSHHHLLSSIYSNQGAWLRSSWLHRNHRHERIAAGASSAGMAVYTREQMERHIEQAPDIRGMLDCLPVTSRSSQEFIGWRQKLGTWEVPKRQT